MKKYELKKLIKEEVKSTLKEGVWALGTKQDIQMFIQDIEDIKHKYHGFVGSDAVYNGLDQAIVEAEELLKIARD